VVAVDTVGAGEGQTVFTAAAGSARAARGLDGRPVDLAVVGIVDEIEMEDR
jgi:ethanolamine utilization protein EutN